MNENIAWAEKLLEEIEEFDVNSKIKELKEYVNAIIKENINLKEQVHELEEKVENFEDGQIATLKEIIDKAESWDYGIKGWRTLETKQDLINAIKKEVLEA